MIEVKGTRSAQAAADPSDPLGLRKPVDAGTGVVAGMVVGLLGLAVYLRSFLWAEPAQALAVPEVKDVPPGEDGPSTRPAARQTLKLAAEESAPPHSAEGPGEANAETQTLPFVLGPADLGVFAVAPAAMQKAFVQAFAANTPLPPFQRAGRPTFPEPGLPPAPIQFPGSDAMLTDLQTLLAPEDSLDAESDDEAANDNGSGSVVTQRNRAPRNSGQVYLGDVGSGAVLAIALSHLLTKTTDEDGDNLTVAMQNATSGTMQPYHGAWRYLADGDQLGEVEIRYSVSDGQHSILQTATLTVIENLHEGTADADLILGTDGRDRVLAHDGDDNIATFLGRDVVFGGAGDDNITGGAGRDSLFGDEGDDLIAGGADADLIFGGDGHDRLHGEAGADEVHGDAGNDLVDGGEGADTLTGDAGEDSLLGGEGDDVLAGGEGDDRAEGGTGLDVIFGDAGADVLLGDAGADLLFGGLGADSLDGGADNDVLSGGEGHDRLLAGSGEDVAAGGDGHDWIAGEAGADYLSGEAGNDWLSGGDGQDTVMAGFGDDVVVIDIDLATDLLDGGEGLDQLVAAPESGSVLFDLIQETVTVDEGTADRISGFEAYVGSAEDDVFLLADGEATLTGGEGADLFAFVQGDRLEAPQSAYGITDFSQADMMTFSNEYAGLSMRKAQRSVEARIEEFFEDYAERFSADEPRLRYFHDWLDDYQRTIVEVDFDHDRTVDLVVSLEGGHEFDISPYST
jgi:Ca2+-binding RTX toxin-like protein